jgi:hypothetical protein
MVSRLASGIRASDNPSSLTLSLLTAGLGGRAIGIAWRIWNTVFHAAGAITTLVPNLFQTNFLTGTFPFVVVPYMTAAPGSSIPFENAVTRFEVPAVYNVQGQPIFASGNSRDVPANTEVDIQRFVQDLAAGTWKTDRSAFDLWDVEGF